MRRLSRSAAAAVLRATAAWSTVRLTSTSADATPPSAETATAAIEEVRFDGRPDKLPRNVVQRIKATYFRGGAVQCELCRTHQSNPSVHQNSHGHATRVALVERALSCLAGVLPEEFADVIKANLDDRLSFDRLPHLSDADAFRRNRKLRYLLRFLLNHGFLAFTATTSSGRGKDFQTCEMFGDNVVKWLLVDRLNAAFPSEQGGLSAGLFLLQSSLDSNEALRAAFDSLGLDSLFGVHSANSKSKSDVVEALFGELQALIWSCECRWESRSEPLSATFAQSVILAVLRHTLNEIAHVMVLAFIDETLRNAKPLMLELYESLSEVQKILASRQAAVEKLNQQFIVQPALQRHPSARTIQKRSNATALSSASMLAKLPPISTRPKVCPTQSPPRYYYRAIRSVAEYQKFVAGRVPEKAARRVIAAREGPVASATSRRSLLLQATACSVYAVVDWNRRCAALSAKLSKERSAMPSMGLPVLLSQQPRCYAGGAAGEEVHNNVRMFMHHQEIMRRAALTAS